MCVPLGLMQVKISFTAGKKLSIWATSWQNQQSECAPSEDSDQPGHLPSLIRDFTVRMKKAWVLSYPLSAQRRLWSDWADAQADLSLRWAHTHFWWFCHKAAHMLIVSHIFPRLQIWTKLYNAYKNVHLFHFLKPVKRSMMSEQPQKYAYCDNENNPNVSFYQSSESGLNSNSVWKLTFHAKKHNGKFFKITPSEKAKFYNQKCEKNVRKFGNRLKFSLQIRYLTVLTGLSYCGLLTGDGRKTVVALTTVWGKQNDHVMFIPEVDIRQRITLFKIFRTNL